jgi:SAM-dependent methyltransferase
MFVELQQGFADLSSWTAWTLKNRWWCQGEYSAALAEDIRRSGFICPVHGYAPPDQIEISGDLRESIKFNWINSRHRAVLKLLLEEDFRQDARIYAPELLTAFASILKTLFPNFIGSEYLTSEHERGALPAIRHENVLELSFPNASLDAYLSCEVFEHVPSIPRALSEAARILRPGGLFLATFPFAVKNQVSIVKATLEPDGSIRYVGEPESHGNPANPEKGSLVFSIPGWDILHVARQSGFRTAEMVAVSSRRHGIAATAPVPIMVMLAVT